MLAKESANIKKKRQKDSMLAKESANIKKKRQNDVGHQSKILLEKYCWHLFEIVHVCGSVKRELETLILYAVGTWKLNTSSEAGLWAMQKMSFCPNQRQKETMDADDNRKQPSYIQLGSQCLEKMCSCLLCSLMKMMPGIG